MRKLSGCKSLSGAPINLCLHNYIVSLHFFTKATLHFLLVDQFFNKKQKWSRPISLIGQKYKKNKIVRDYEDTCLAAAANSPIILQISTVVNDESKSSTTKKPTFQR